MITREQMLNAIGQLRSTYNSLTKEAWDLRQAIIDIQRKFDEDFIEKVFNRNRIELANTREACVFKDTDGGEFRIHLRKAGERKESFSTYFGGKRNPNGIVSMSFNGNMFNEIMCLGYKTDSDFSVLFTNNTHYKSSTDDELVLLENDGNTYRRIMACHKKLESYKAAIQSYFWDVLPKVAEFMKDSYDRAIRLDNDNTDEFKAIFGESLKPEPQTIELNIKLIIGA